MAITARAREALEKARALEHQKKWKDAWYYYTIASREKSSEGTRGVERMLRKLEDDDIIDSAEIIRDRREANTPTEKPKIVSSISIPSEEQRTLIEDRSKLQQKPKVQQKKSNKTERKTKEQTDNKTGKEMQTDNELAELQKKAAAGDTDAQVKLAKELEKRKKRSEANTWWKQAADNGHPEARAKVGQWYLERALKYLGQQSILEKLEEKIPPPRKGDKPESPAAPKPHFRHQRNMISEQNGGGDMAETETLQDLGSKEEPEDVKETPSAPVKKETEREGAGGTTAANLSNRATIIGETAKPLHEQKTYHEAILNLIARYQLARFRSGQASVHQHADAENLCKKGEKESDECPHTISLTLDDTAWESSVTEPESCSEEDTPTNHTTVNFYDTVVAEPQVIVQELVYHVTYWSGNDCLPELIIVDAPAPEAWEFSRESGQAFSTENISWQEIPPAAIMGEEVPRLMGTEEVEQQPKHGCMAKLSQFFKNIFTIFRR